VRRATDRAAQRTLAKLVTKAPSASETPKPTQTPSGQPNPRRIGSLIARRATTDGRHRGGIAPLHGAIIEA
jgi:hypothetical protein